MFGKIIKRYKEYKRLRKEKEEQRIENITTKEIEKEMEHHKKEEERCERLFKREFHDKNVVFSGTKGIIVGYIAEYNFETINFELVYYLNITHLMILSDGVKYKVSLDKVSVGDSE